MVRRRPLRKNGRKRATMSWGAYAILIIFGAFILLLVINPNMSCFGKRIRSPFYPLKRRRTMKRKPTDYKFNLGDKAARDAMAGGTPAAPGKKAGDKKTEDYGFRLD
jgi:hypothetical protein